MITILRQRVANNNWYLEGQGHSMTLQQNRFRPITLLFEVGIYKYFTVMNTILRLRVAHNIWVATLKVKVTTWPCSRLVSSPKLCYLKSVFTTISQKWSPYWDEMSRATFWSLLWRSRWQHALKQKRVRPISLFFKVEFYNCLTEMITILR